MAWMKIKIYDECNVGLINKRNRTNKYFNTVTYNLLSHAIRKAV